MSTPTGNPLNAPATKGAKDVVIHCDGNAQSGRPDFLVGLSWDFYGGKKVDLDASAVFFDNLGQVKEAVFYNNLTAFDGGVVHSGESLDGEGEGFDESISIDVDKIPPTVNFIVILVNAYKDNTSFADVESAIGVLQDFPPGQENPRILSDVSIGCRGTNEGLILATVERSEMNPKEWRFKSVGQAIPKGRNFNECMPALRKLIDSRLPDWVKDERSLSSEKTFDMKKGNAASIPAKFDKVMVGLGWDCSSSVDLDSSIIIMKDAKIQNIVYYGNKKDGSYGVSHHGDNTTGAGSGDDEKISIDLKKAAKSPGTSLVVVVNVFSSTASFSSVRNAYVRLLLPDGKVLAKYVLDGKIKTTGLIFAELYYDNRGWHLTALGIPKPGRTAKDAGFKSAVSRIRQGGKLRADIVPSSNGVSNGASNGASNGTSGGCCIIA
jgi:tellurium resistance protein TerZ